MNIDRISDQAQNLLRSNTPSPRRANTPQNRPGVISRIKDKYQKHMALVNDIAEINSDAVGRAKALILAGKLDTPDNLRGAAANMLKFGI